MECNYWQDSNGAKPINVVSMPQLNPYRLDNGTADAAASAHRDGFAIFRWQLNGQMPEPTFRGGHTWPTCAQRQNPISSEWRMIGVVRSLRNSNKDQKVPELPEVETVRRGLETVLLGARFSRVDQRRPDLRFPFPERFAERLAGRTVEGLWRRAKYLIADLDGADALVMHLGMSGSFRIQQALSIQEPAPEAGIAAKNPAHDHVAFELSTGARVVYNDPRRFGFMLLISRHALAAHPLLQSAGIEPLGDEFDGAALAKLFAGRRTSLKAALLDQKLVAGLGNIYVCEALYRACLSPRRSAITLVRKNGAPSADALRLARAIREVLEEAIAAGGSSLRDHRKADGGLGYFQHNFGVYGRASEPCIRCGGTIKRITQSGRATFYCGSCQR
jgi:formamidopyrimidine-DNA glycosylase